MSQLLTSFAWIFLVWNVSKLWILVRLMPKPCKKRVEMLVALEFISVSWLREEMR